MNKPPRNETPAHDPRDPELARLYRESMREEPPAYLDTAIHAAARREVNPRRGEPGLAHEANGVVSAAASPSRPALGGVGSGLRPRLFAAPLLRSWRLPASIAAVVVLSVSIATLMIEERPEELAEPLRGASKAVPERPSAEVADPATAPQPFSGAPPAAASRQERRREPTPALRRDSATPPTAVMNAPQREPAEPVSPRSALVRDYEFEPPEKWVEKIAELRREGRTAEAEEWVAEFKRRFPNHSLPAVLTP